MIELTEQQGKELEGSELPVAVDPRTQRTYVLIPTSVYERIQDWLYDASPWTNDELDRLATEDADSLGWDGMEAYQDKEQ